MYLLAFVTLIISLLGMYTQVLAIEVARVASQQTSIAGAMLTWHKAAVSMAAKIVDTNQYRYAPLASNSYGCSLTDKAYLPSFLTLLPNAGGNFARCPTPLTTPCPANGSPGTCTSSLTVNPPSQQVNVFGSGTITDAANCASGLCNLTLSEPVHLPADYNTSNASGYQFYSALYQTGGTDVVVTFVAPPLYTGNSTGFLTLANGSQIAVTSGDLMKQLQLAGGKEYMFGHISSSPSATMVQITSIRDTSTLTPINLSFPLPGTFSCTATPCPLDGAIAVVSSPDGL